MGQFLMNSSGRMITGLALFVVCISVSMSCGGPKATVQRNAAIIKQKDSTLFNDSYDKVVYLKEGEKDEKNAGQGWSPDDSLWFYSTTQGSDLMPYDFFMVLKQEKDKGKFFRDPENMDRYRYLAQEPSPGNLDALPVGWVKDEYKGKQYVGLTCAACHTAQINYKGTGIRIDGGPTGADMESLMEDIVSALEATLKNENVRREFVKDVLERKNYNTEKSVLDDLNKYIINLEGYVKINHSRFRYGYSRLDAFGRIYNRVLEHVIDSDTFLRLLVDILREDLLPENPEKVELIKERAKSIIEYNKREHIVNHVINSLEKEGLLTLKQINRLQESIFIVANAPVSYPFLWDTPQHDYVQWNGIAANAGLGPVGRNAGEVIGVFGTLDWANKIVNPLYSLITGQGYNTTAVKFESSVNVHNLSRLESRLWNLKSPKWPEEILSKIDQGKARRGKDLFKEYCEKCHANIDRESPDRRVVANMAKVSDVGTDPQMAKNSIAYTGYSGILLNQYVSVGGVGDILIGPNAPVAALLTKATAGVVATPDTDKFILTRGIDWVVDLSTSFFRNDIKPSVKTGNYNTNTTADPLASLDSYKSRPLNGIWATAPYLHNGSVPTLYDLLLRKKTQQDPNDPGDPNDPKKRRYRLDKFKVGTREFDPEYVGFKTDGYVGFTFDTEFPGNYNTGHEYPSRKESENGLTEDERMELLEYLKTL